MPDDINPSPDRVSRFYQTAKSELTTRLENILDQSFSKALPDAVRTAWIKTAAEQFTTYVQQTPPESSLTQKQILEKAIEELENTDHPSASFITKKIRSLAINTLNESLDPDKFYQLRQAAEEAKQLRQQNLTDSSITAKKILEKIPQNKRFALKEKDTEEILHHIRNQKEVINNPTQNQVKLALQEIIDNQGAINHQEPSIAIQEFSKQLLRKHTDDIHHYVQSTTDPLPQETLFTPFKPTISANTVRQARDLGVSPLSLAYTKSGFQANDPKLSKDLQSEVSQIQQILKDPSDPNNQLSIKGHFTAFKLKPQVFLSQKYYHPVYQSYQKAKAKGNIVFEKPFEFFKSTNQQYQHYKEKYQEFTRTKKWGWLTSPRLRSRMAADKAKLGVSRAVRYQLLKTSKRRKVLRTYNKWKPSGITRRFKGWVKNKSIHLTIKTGSWLIKKGAKKLGGFLVKASLLAVESASVVAIPLVILQLSFSLAKGLFKKLKHQIQEQRYSSDSAGIAAKAFQTILGGLKALGAMVLGSIGGLIGSLTGALVGFLIGNLLLPGIGGIIGGIVGFFAGGILGTSLGALIGYNWIAIAAVPAAIGAYFISFFSSLTGAGVAVPVTVGFGAAGGAAILANHTQNVASSAFFLPNIDLDQLISPENPLGVWLKWPYVNKESSAHLTSCFGKRCGTDWSSYHGGLDMLNGYGAAIYPAAPGKVINTGTDSDYGKFIIIDHLNGWFTLYAHLSSISAHSGSNVDINTKIGAEGNTGNVFPPPTAANPQAGAHLHFSVSQGSSLSSFYYSTNQVIDPCTALPNCSCNAAQLNSLNLCTD